MTTLAQIAVKRVVQSVSHMPRSTLPPLLLGRGHVLSFSSSSSPFRLPSLYQTASPLQTLLSTPSSARWLSSTTRPPKDQAAKVAAVEGAEQSASNPTEVLSAHEYRKRHNITVAGDSVPDPIQFFESTAFPEPVKAKLKALGFAQPTPIQAQGWATVMAGRDMIGIAETGSGKTLAFMLPALSIIKHAPPTPTKKRRLPQVLVLAPTRELARQIIEASSLFTRSANVKAVPLYGGSSFSVQFKALMTSPEIIVSTPGRLIDMVDRGALDLSNISYLVLDEADRMLDMGFEPQIRNIVERLNEKRQTVMWSATWPKEVQELAHDFLNNPIKCTIGTSELFANKNITQLIECVEPSEKKDKLLEKLKTTEGRVLIFTDTKRDADMICYYLEKNGHNAASLHGDKTQYERDRIMSEFKSKEVPILVATDVAARGLDVKDLQLVINFDFPRTLEDYIHRIGRTGRAGNTGEALSFFTADRARLAKKLVKILETCKQAVPAALEAYIKKPVFDADIEEEFSRYRRQGSSVNRNWRGGRSSGGFGGGRSQSERPRFNKADARNPIDTFDEESDPRETFTRSPGRGRFNDAKSRFGGDNSGFGNRDRQRRYGGDWEERDEFQPRNKFPKQGRRSPRQEGTGSAQFASDRVL